MASLIGVGLVYKGFEVQRQRARQASCISNLKNVGLGMSQYVRDYDEHYPLAANWSGALLPYTKSKALFQCPNRGAEAQGYGFHREAAGISQAAFFDSRINILLFDSAGRNANTSDTGKSVPFPARHPAGHTLGFADGHVKVMARPDFKAGYDGSFARNKAKAAAASARFWAELREVQRIRKIRQDTAKKKAKTP